MSEKPGKRLVSKKQYVLAVGTKTLLSVSGLGLCVGGLVGLASCLVLCMLVGSDSRHVAGAWSVLGTLSVMWVVLLAVGRILLKKGKKLDTGILLTRANTGELPASDSLVRASNAPLSHQQAELLRAAQPGQEMPPEELLRATQGNRDSKP